MDKLGLMASFVAVVEQGSYTAAGQQLGKTKAIISKQVSQLEDHFQTRLINRTTRTLSITDSGRVLYERCRAILDEVATLESVASGNEGVAGRLRISAPQSFGELQLMSEIAVFMQQYPDVSIELILNDLYVDLVADNFDLALRIGQMDDSNLIARKVSSMASVLVAEPSLAKKYKHIKMPEDLVDVPCIYDSNRRTGTKWSFTKNDTAYNVKVQARLSVNSAVAAYKAVLDGMGLALLPDFTVQEALDSGQLVQLLSDYKTTPVGIYIIYPHRHLLSNNVKVFTEFLYQRWSGAGT